MSSTTPTQSAAVSQEYTVLQALAAHYLTNKTLSAPLLLSLTAALSSELSTVKTLSLVEKKQLICDIIDSSLQNALALSKAGVGSPVLAAEEVVALNYVVKNVVPHTVDLLVATANGQFNLKTVKASCWACLPVAAAKLRGPVWDVADAFVVAAEKSASVGGSLSAAVGAGVAAAEDAGMKAAAAVTAAVPVVPDWTGPHVDLSGSTVPSNPV